MKKLGESTEHEIIGQSRLLVMGIATLWIALFHGTMKAETSWMKYFIELGYLGTDMFMFLSGFSMYHSYTRSCCGDSRKFLARRMNKILPTFVPCAVVLYVEYFRRFSNRNDILLAMRDKTFWIDLVVLRWFVPAICLAYFMTPLLEWVFRKSGYTLRTLIVILLILFVMSLLFEGSSVALMVLTRLMEYVIGFWYGKDPQRRLSAIGRVGISALAFAVLISLMCRYSYEALADTGLLWYPIIPAISSVVVLNARFFAWIREKYVGLYIDNALSKVGGVTLEIYLWHQFILRKAEMLICLDKGLWAVNVIGLSATIAWAFAYQKVIGMVIMRRGLAMHGRTRK